ncbi:mariner Mos1 transposase [Trichonephila clavipes]|nr:mariner Mos1 transposase [Trichonephila clavipes]
MSNFMPSDHDLRTSLIFCYLLKKNDAESHQMLIEAYGGNTLSREQYYRGFEKFPNGDFDVRNEERGRPAKKFEDAELLALLYENDGQTHKHLAEQLNVDQSTVSRRRKANGQDNKDRKREQYKKRQRKVIFLDDNAPSHLVKPTKDIVKAFGWEPLARAAYLPDDFFRLPPICIIGTRIG